MVSEKKKGKKKDLTVHGHTLVDPHFHKKRKKEVTYMWVHSVSMHDLIANQRDAATKWSQNVSWRLTGHDSQVSGQWPSPWMDACMSWNTQKRKERRNLIQLMLMHP